MSALDWLSGLIGIKNQAPVDSALIRRGDGVWESFTGNLNDAPSERLAMQVTAVSACVNLISGAIASLPMHVYSRSPDGDLTRDMNSDVWWILNEEFAPRWTASSGWAFLTASKLLHGDGFAEILRRGDRIIGLVPIHPNRVRVIATPDGSRLVYEVQPDPTIESPNADVSRIRVLDQDDVLHVPGFGFNGLRGLSALRNSLKNSGTIAINAQNFSENFLRNMARPDFALKTEGHLTDEQFVRLQEMLDQRSGPMNAGKPMILEGGLNLEALTMPLEEMQLLETRKFQVEEIARAFGVQPFMIGHTEKSSSWGSGIEAMGAGFVRYTLRDHLNAFQNEINRKFFRTPTQVAEFDTTELERGDTKAMFEAMRVGLGRAGESAILTIEEARQTLRLPRQMPAGDTPPNAGGGGNADAHALTLDDYAVAVRAGVITPQVEDEITFRASFGLPDLSENGVDLWDAQGGIRQPITLQSGKETEQQAEDAEGAGSEDLANAPDD